jgi:hypothetical protein
VHRLSTGAKLATAQLPLVQGSSIADRPNDLLSLVTGFVHCLLLEHTIGKRVRAAGKADAVTTTLVVC